MTFVHSSQHIYGFHAYIPFARHLRAKQRHLAATVWILSIFFFFLYYSVGGNIDNDYALRERYCSIPRVIFHVGEGTRNGYRALELSWEAKRATMGRYLGFRREGCSCLPAAGLTRFGQASAFLDTNVNNAITNHERIAFIASDFYRASSGKHSCRHIRCPSRLSGEREGKRWADCLCENTRLWNEERSVRDDEVTSRNP